MSKPQQPSFIILCGKTGSGKSAVLHYLSLLHYPVIDLEAIAGHRGSAFGSAGFTTPQPSQQAFNEQLHKCYETFSSHPYIFVEHKPVAIGKRRLPSWFSDLVQEGMIVELHIPQSIRIQNIIREYFDTERKRQDMLAALHKLSGRFSKQEILSLQELLSNGDYTSFVRHMLCYYDQTANYQYGGKEPFLKICCDSEFSAERISGKIIEAVKSVFVDAVHP